MRVLCVPHACHCYSFTDQFLMKFLNIRWWTRWSGLVPVQRKRFCHQVRCHNLLRLRRSSSIAKVKMLVVCTVPLARLLGRMITAPTSLANWSASCTPYNLITIIGVVCFSVIRKNSRPEVVSEKNLLFYYDSLNLQMADIMS